MKNILIIYGTTTGNSEKIAHLCEEVLQNKFNVSVKNCIDFSCDFTSDDFYILCTSTWGIDPASLQEDFEIFWGRLNKNNLRDKKFIVIGLGDNFYPNFAAAADILQADILAAGGIMLASPLKIDDSVAETGILLRGYLQKTLPPSCRA
ncbi:MAG: flavodoxin-like domain-containing protein [Alphaproteobacteria bacterium]|jgi:flavodoxin|nr:flavodoxin-like domain-containing protein [Alphaproteobacteria bacterium]